MLARIDQINAEISELDAVIEDLLAPWDEQLQQAGSMPGWGRRSAEDVLAETGPDMTRFPTGGHLASWVPIPMIPIGRSGVFDRGGSEAA
jgi:transposase